MSASERIDAHQHYWRLDRGDYGWLTPALAPIYRDFLPADLRPLLARHGIARTLLVQAAPTPAETDFLLELARADASIAGVIGWADFAAPGAGAVIARLARHPALVGLRPMVQDIADDDWLLRDELKPAFEAMIEHGLVFDALVLPRHLSRLGRVVERFPALTVVIDHGAKPPIRQGPAALEPWRSRIAALAAAPRVFCKLSGLVTEAAAGWRSEDLRPWVEHLLLSFGAARLLWGSDWPVFAMGGGYDRWRRATLALLSPLDAGEQDGILGGNAAAVYLARKGAGAVAS